MSLLAMGEVSIDLTTQQLTYVAIVALIAVAAIVFAGVLVRQVLAAPEGTEGMQEIARAVQEGASAYLTRQFRTLAVFAVVVFFLLYLLPADTTSLKIGRSAFFIIGALFSAVTGYVGMWLAVRANVRVAAAARGGSEQSAMKIAIRTGGVAGMFTVGLGLFGAATVVLIYQGDAPVVLEGFGFGAAMLAMFMRVGGGIFTKAADVGADLVGKVEQGIPEDDPRNAATIADNVGDNVGDCAGMAADLFESYAVTLVAALILGKAAFGDIGLVFPLIVPAIGVITAVIGIMSIAPRPGDRSGMTAITRGFFISAAFSVVMVIAASFWLIPARAVDLTGVVVDGSGGVFAAVDVDTYNLRAPDDWRGAHRHRAGCCHPAADRLLHRDQPPPGRRRCQVLTHRSGHGHLVRRLAGSGVCGLLGAPHRRSRLRSLPARGRVDHVGPLRRRPGRYRSAHHGRGDRGDGHLRPGLGQRSGHRGDVRGRRR